MIEYWTDERVEELRSLWRSNSASEIAAMMGASRNAVLGKAHRLGLDSKLKPAVPKCLKKPTVPRSVTVYSTVTRLPTATRRIETPEAEMSKTAMRAMLQQAVVNTGGRVA